MWVIYFNIGAERASRQIASSKDPGRLARSGYTYLHILIVAGIIVAAVGDELALHHPGNHNDLATAAVLLGGPALYLLGNALFKRLTAPNTPLSHLAGLAMLALLILAVPFTTPLLLSSATTAVLMIVAAWESDLAPRFAERQDEVARHTTAAVGLSTGSRMEDAISGSMKSIRA